MKFEPGSNMILPLPGVLTDPTPVISMFLSLLSVRVFGPLKITEVEIGVIFSVTVKVALMVFVPEPVKETLAKLPAPMEADGVPVKITVLVVPGVKVPRLSQSP